MILLNPQLASHLDAFNEDQIKDDKEEKKEEGSILKYRGNTQLDVIDASDRHEEEVFPSTNEEATISRHDQNNDKSANTKTPYHGETIANIHDLPDNNNTKIKSTIMRENPSRRYDNDPTIIAIPLAATFGFIIGILPTESPCYTILKLLIGIIAIISMIIPNSINTSNYIDDNNSSFIGRIKSFITQPMKNHEYHVKLLPLEKEHVMGDTITSCEDDKLSDSQYVKRYRNEVQSLLGSIHAPPLQAPILSNSNVGTLDTDLYSILSRMVRAQTSLIGTYQQIIQYIQTASSMHLGLGPVSSAVRRVETVSVEGEMRRLRCRQTEIYTSSTPSKSHSDPHIHLVSARDDAGENTIRSFVSSSSSSVLCMKGCRKVLYKTMRIHSSNLSQLHQFIQRECQDKLSQENHNNNNNNKKNRDNEQASNEEETLILQEMERIDELFDGVNDDDEPRILTISLLDGYKNNLASLLSGTLSITFLYLQHFKLSRHEKIDLNEEVKMVMSSCHEIESYLEGYFLGDGDFGAMMNKDSSDGEDSIVAKHKKCRYHSAIKDLSLLQSYLQAALVAIQECHTSLVTSGVSSVLSDNGIADEDRTKEENKLQTSKHEMHDDAYSWWSHLFSVLTHINVAYSDMNERFFHQDIDRQNVSSNITDDESLQLAPIPGHTVGRDKEEYDDNGKPLSSIKNSDEEENNTQHTSKTMVFTGKGTLALRKSQTLQDDSSTTKALKLPLRYDNVGSRQHLLQELQSRLEKIGESVNDDNDNDEDGMETSSIADGNIDNDNGIVTTTRKSSKPKSVPFFLGVGDSLLSELKGKMDEFECDVNFDDDNFDVDTPQK